MKGEKIPPPPKKLRQRQILCKFPHCGANKGFLILLCLSHLNCFWLFICIFVLADANQGDKDFTPAAAQVAHQKPQPGIPKLPSSQHINQHIHQPRKWAGRSLRCGHANSTGRPSQLNTIYRKAWMSSDWLVILKKIFVCCEIVCNRGLIVFWLLFQPQSWNLPCIGAALIVVHFCLLFPSFWKS